MAFFPACQRYVMVQYYYVMLEPIVDLHTVAIPPPQDRD